MVSVKRGLALYKIFDRAGNCYLSIDEQAAAILMVLMIACQFQRNSRTTQAATNVSFRIDHTLIHIGWAMYNDGTFQGIVIDALFHSFEAQGITIVPFVGITCNIKNRGCFESFPGLLEKQVAISVPEFLPWDT